MFSKSHPHFVLDGHQDSEEYKTGRVHRSDKCTTCLRLYNQGMSAEKSLESPAVVHRAALINELRVEIPSFVLMAHFSAHHHHL